MNIYRIIFLALVFTALSAAFPVYAQQNPPSKQLVDKQMIRMIKAFVNVDIVKFSIKDQNRKYVGMSEKEILKLDKQWRAETKKTDQPLISATLSSPLSSYLTRVQAHSSGLYTEMFAMDNNGLNVGQSNISSDYWQGDEAKFQKTYLMGRDAVFVDDPEYDESLDIWRVQVNMSIADEDQAKAIGAITVEINLSELERRKALGLI